MTQPPSPLPAGSKREEPRGEWLALGIGLGTCLGAAFGYVFDDMTMTLPLGMVFGLIIGLLLDNLPRSHAANGEQPPVTRG